MQRLSLAVGSQPFVVISGTSTVFLFPRFVNSGFILISFLFPFLVTLYSCYIVEFLCRRVVEV